MKIDKKQLIIYGGIALIIVIVIILYLMNRIEQEEKNYDNLEIASTTLENAVNKEPEKIKVHIAGSVVNEGIVELEEGARIEDAIKEAGGTTPDANMKEVNLAYKIQDGQKIYIPNMNEEETEIVKETNTEINTIKNTGIININTATQTELELLPGIGPSTASKIIEYREQNGKFLSIEDIKEVPGIGESKYENIEGKITV